MRDVRFVFVSTMHGIHSTSSTDLSKLRSNLARAKSNTANVVLISTGSFSPIHRCHLANLIRTKEYFENVCHFNVLAGFLSPSHDDYVEAKLGSAFLPSSVRIELCEKAIEEEKQQDWMSVDRAEALGKSFRFSRTLIDQPTGIPFGYLQHQPASFP